MAEAPSQPGGTNPDESWDKFLHLVSGLETSESDLADAEASGDLDAPTKTSSAPQHHLATAGSSKSTGSLSAPVDKVENRRMIQKRYREREKERSRVTQGLLAEAQRQLQLAENEKRLLQSRLQTFEDLMSQHGQRRLPPVATLVATPQPLTQPLALPYSLMPPTQEATAALQPYHMAPSSGQGSSNPLPYNATSTEEQGASDLLSILLLPSVKLTCLGSAEVHLTPQQISQLPLGQYANLYTACVTDLSSLARGVAGSRSSQMMEQQMLNKVIEATCLILARAMCDPDGMVKNHDFDAADRDHETDQPPVPYNHAIMGALALSQSQKDDILMLRRLFFSELGRLSQERQDLYDSMARHSNRLSRVKAYAEQLQQNVTAQHQTYLQMLQALYLGLLTTRQTAASMLAAYPRFFGRSLFEGLAIERGEPPAPAIMEHHDIQQCLQWPDVTSYVSKLMLHNMSGHVPFIASAHPGGWSGLS